MVVNTLHMHLLNSGKWTMQQVLDRYPQYTPKQVQRQQVTHQRLKG